MFKGVGGVRFGWEFLGDGWLSQIERLVWRIDFGGIVGGIVGLKVGGIVGLTCGILCSE